MKARDLIAKIFTATWITLIAGCGGSDRIDLASLLSSSGQASNYAVGGSVFGLLGVLAIDINGSDTLTLSTDGTFKFSNSLAVGSHYSVTVHNQPANQICTVSNGSGTITNTAVTNIVVNCSTLTRTVSGTVLGLASSQSAVLQNNGSDNLTINSNGNFTFSIPVAQSAAYNVTVLTQPATQTCTIANPSGVTGSTNITDVQVTCSDNAYTVGGTVSGLTGTVTLQNNGADNLSINSNGTFTFSTPVAQGASYNTTILAQPATQTCIVTNGSGPMGSTNIANIGVNCTTNTTTLSLSVSNLALSATGLTEYGVSGTPASGASRTITVTNTGSNAAFNLSVTPPTWPTGTTNSTTCSSTLTASASCTITIIPGAIATSDGTNSCSIGTAPIPGAVQIAADNANSVSSNVVILNYGCIYQGGYVYALDDTTANTASVGGKVSTTTDQSLPFPAGVIWSSLGSGGSSSDVAYDSIYGTSDTSTTSSPNPNSGQVAGQVACNGAADGACTTNNIYVYYQNNAANAPINLSYYAAGLCKQTISGFSDWSLPAICELGYGNMCGTSSTPLLQNMQSNLVDFNNLNLLSSYYWSSTEYSLSLQNFAWGQDFASGGNSLQFGAPKDSQLDVRCSRALSP